MYRDRVIGARATILAATAALAICAGAGFAPPPASAAEYAASFAPLVDQVRGAVVNISTTEVQKASAQSNEMPEFPPGSPFGEFMRRFGAPGGGGEPGGEPMRQGPIKALGSGFIIDPSGFVVTNNHVVENGSDIKVTLQDGTTLDAKVVGKDPVGDLAVLKVEAGHPLPSLQFGDSSKARVGDWVISVGNPFGLGGTVTAGIVSASGRDVPSEEHSAYVDYLQIDAPINRGNSGGPTFNEQGQVIGINTAIYSPNGGGSVGIGFAIPSNIAKPIVEQLEKNGAVTRGWFGVEMQAITPDMEDALGLSSTNGVVIADVQPDGPAAKAGLKSGDVVTGFGDQSIKSTHELALAVANTAPGQTVQVKITRDGKADTIPVKIEQLKADKGAVAENDAEGGKGSLGLNLAPLDKAARQELGLSASATGAVVSGVKPDSPAELQGIRAGDVLVRVDNTPVQNPGDAVAAVKKATKAGKKAVAILINRGGNNLFVAIPLAHSAG